MKPSDNEIEMLATGFAIQHKNGLIRFAHALLDKYAPQASAEDVRNAALDVVREALDAATVHPCDEHDDEARAATLYGPVRKLYDALKTQEDKDGGQQRAGDGKTREALSWYAEKVAGCRKFGPDGEAARHALDRDGGQLARAALSAPQAEQGERDAK